MAKSQYHNAVACGLAVNSVRAKVDDIAATHTLPRCGTDFFATWLQFGCGSAALCNLQPVDVLLTHLLNPTPKMLAEKLFHRAIKLKAVLLV